MEFIVWVETRLGGKTLEIHEVAKMDRVATGIGPEELGLTLADVKVATHPKMLYGENAFEISGIEEIETEAR